jgi:SHS2 domain-containing protein
MYEVFDHTADIGLRIRAETLEELFSEAARALFSLIVMNLGDVQPRERIDFSVPIRDHEYDYLLFDWLNELLFTFDSRQMLLVKFDVRISSAGLKATAMGEAIDVARHRLDHEVKAITYHGLKAVQEGDKWLAEVIVDI